MIDCLYDVAVIGAGVVGAAIARELARYQLHCVLIDAAEDVGTGTSKANTALLHTGFDAQPGTLEARLLPRGHALLTEYAREAGIPHEAIGALMVAWNDTETERLGEVETKARRNGYHKIRRLTPAELYQRESRLGPGARAGLEIPGEGIICPFTTPLAFATQAVVNGVVLRLDTEITGVETDGAENHILRGGNGQIRTRYVVNASGLNADTLDRLFGHHRFTVTPRRGELVVFDKLARRLVSHIILPVPTPVSKGVLVSPTVFGNVLLGPTAEDVADKTCTDSTRHGLANLWQKGAHIVPELLDEEVTAVYAGLRAATADRDYQIRSHPAQRYVCVGGIRSTGLSGSMAIAEHVAELLFEAGLPRRPKAEFEPVRMPMIGESGLRPYQDGEAIARNPDYGRLVCHCERVSLGEIVDACQAVIPARNLDGLRRRTRAQLGRCQTFYCGARLLALLQRYGAIAPAAALQVEPE